MNGAATAVPLREAAARMGMSTDTLRKRLQRGLTPGRKVDGQWFVVPGPGPDLSGSVQDTAGPGRDQTGPVPDTPDGPAAAADAPQEAPGGALLGDRAAEMARYSRELLAPVLARLEQQATEIGVLTERTATLQATVEAQARRIAELVAPPPPSPSAPQDGAAPGGAERRPSWWQRLLWG